MATLPAVTTFLKPAPRTGARPSLRIVWEVPPPDFEIPDEPMDNEDQSLLADAIRDALSGGGLISRTRLAVTSIALCAKVNGKTVTKAPDWFYVPAVKPAEHRRSYTPVAEGGMPVVVMEFLSDNQGREYDTSSVYPYGKWYFYEKIVKIPWYVIFDSESGRLEVYRLVNGRYQIQTPDEQRRYWIEPMQLFLGVWAGLKEDVDKEIFWLRWWNTDRSLLPWRYERERQAAERANHAERNRQKVEHEKQAAERARQTAERARQTAERARQEAERAQQAALMRAERAEREKQEAFMITAQKMLQAGLDIAVISQVTGLDEGEISNLKRRLSL